MGKTVNKLVKMSTLGLVDLDPELPDPGKKKVMPDVDDEEVKKLKSRELQRRKRSGRTATVLSEGSKLG